MKSMALILFAISLTSCNTTIGLWRDTKAGYRWTSQKIQESQSGSQDTEYGAPVY